MRVRRWGAAAMAAATLFVVGGSAVPAAVPSFISVVAGAKHTCGLTAQRSVYCWGSNYLGQVGDGSGTDRTIPTPVAVGEGLAAGTVVAISAGLTHTCALTFHGRAYCWGYNGGGRLGDGTTAQFRPAPVLVRSTPSLPHGRVRAVAAGGRHTCAIAEGGSASCWGTNDHGQLGDGSTTSRGLPAPVALGIPVSAIGPGNLHTCALTTSRRLFCFGYNQFGQLGDGTLLDAPTPREVGAGQGLVPGTVAAVDAGAAHTCALTAGGAAYCWGRNTTGQLGDGAVLDQPLPVQVQAPLTGGDFTANAISAGAGHTCVVARVGVHCWGDNTMGQLGTGGPPVSARPLRVLSWPATGETPVSASAGEQHTCGYSQKGTILCWGAGTAGQSGSVRPVSPIPAPADRAAT